MVAALSVAMVLSVAMNLWAVVQLNQAREQISGLFCMEVGR